MNPVVIEGQDPGELIAMFRYLMAVITAYWEGHREGKLSRYVAPPRELEEDIIVITNDIWRALGDGLRAGLPTVTVVTSMDAPMAATIMDSASKMLAFIPYVREAGVRVPDDPETHAKLVALIEAVRARAVEISETRREVSVHA